MQLFFIVMFCCDATMSCGKFISEKEKSATCHSTNQKEKGIFSFFQFTFINLGAEDERIIYLRLIKAGNNCHLRHFLFLGSRSSLNSDRDNNFPVALPSNG